MQKMKTVKIAKRVSYIMLIALLCINTVSAFNLTEAEKKEGLEKKIQENKKLEREVDGLSFNTRLYVKKIEFESKKCINDFVITLTTYREDASLTKEEWKRELSKYAREIGATNNFTFIYIFLQHRGVKGSEEKQEKKEPSSQERSQQENILSMLVEMTRRRTREGLIVEKIVEEEEVEEIIREIRKGRKERKEVYLPYLLEYCMDEIKSICPPIDRNAEFFFLGELLFFYPAADLLACVREKMVYNTFVMNFVSSSYILYHPKKKMMYKVEKQELGQNSSLPLYSEVEVEDEKYRIIQRKDSVRYRLCCTRSSNNSFYILARDIISRNILTNPTQNLDSISGMYHFMFSPKTFPTPIRKEEEYGIIIRCADGSYKFDTTPSTIAYILCIFRKDKRGKLVAEKISLEILQTEYVRIYLEITEEEKGKGKGKEKGLCHSAAQERRRIDQDNASKCRTIKKLTINNWNFVKYLTIEKQDLIKIEKIALLGDIVSYCTKEQGFDGSLLSLARRWSFCDVLEFKLDLEDYFKYVIEYTNFTDLIDNEMEKRNMVLKDLEKWNPSKEKNYIVIEYKFRISKDKIKKEEERLLNPQRKKDSKIVRGVSWIWTLLFGT